MQNARFDLIFLGTKMNPMSCCLFDPVGNSQVPIISISSGGETLVEVDGFLHPKGESLDATVLFGVSKMRKTFRKTHICWKKLGLL